MAEEPEPPPILTARDYEAGEMACLSITPSWDAPIVIFKKAATITNSLFGNDIVDFIWPTWNEKIDYTSMADPIEPKKPREDSPAEPHSASLPESPDIPF
jgi:hypothetical protein